MLRFLSGVAMVAVALVVVLFSVANRQAVPVDLWPLPFVLSLPLFMVVLGAVIVGFLAGGTVAWLSAGRFRRAARRSRREVTGMEKDLATLRQRIHELEERSPEKAPH